MQISLTDTPQKRALIFLFALAVIITGCKQAAVDEAQSLAATYIAATETEIAAATETALPPMLTAEHEEMLGATETEVAANRTATAEIRLTPSTEELRQDAMRAKVGKLFEGGFISKQTGNYHALPDFDERWAQLRYYRIHEIPHRPVDFVFRADLSWETASMTADWDSSGCGIIYRADPDNHYLSFLALDGFAYFIRVADGQEIFLGRGGFGRVDLPAGEAEMLISVEGSQFYFFVNGREVLHSTDFVLNDGATGLTIISGTNAGFGTHCLMENVDLWILEGSGPGDAEVFLGDQSSISN